MLGFWVWGFAFSARDFEFGVRVLGLELGFSVWGLGLGFGSRVLRFGCRVFVVMKELK